MIIHFVLKTLKLIIIQVTVEDGVYSDDAYILASPDNLVIWSGVQRENMQEETDQAKRFILNKLLLLS